MLTCISFWGVSKHIFAIFIFAKKTKQTKNKRNNKKINLKRLKSMHIFSIARRYIYVHVCTHVSFTK